MDYVKPKAWIVAETTKEGGVATWWLKMSDEDKEEYVAEHPNSKYADMHRTKKVNPTTPEPTPEPAPEPTTTNSEHKAEAEKFINSPEGKPNSPVRKKIGDYLKSRPKAFASHIKAEVKIWKTAGTALKGLTQGRALTADDKKAIGTAATDIAILLTSTVAISGGILAMLNYGGGTLIKKTLIKAAYRSVVYTASSLEIYASMEDKILMEAIKMLGEELESGDLSKLLKEDTEQEALTAKLDMSAEVAGKGNCPECKKPMIQTLVGNTPMWACSDDRITLPMPNHD